MLADKLNMTPDEAERWIRNERLDAKIDSKLGHAVMGNNAVSLYQQKLFIWKPDGGHECREET